MAITGESRVTTVKGSESWMELSAARTLGDADEPSLSVVIPTLNEEEGIAACLESVFTACSDIPGFEVIIVDSNSDDGTVDVAQEYPVTVLRLSPDERITPGAARYVGSAAACGDYILFVDGDMEIADDWLADARRFLSKNETVAGVGGYLNETDTDAVKTVKTLNGVMLYDAEILAQSGGFDPDLYGYEDIELSFRLRSDGYELVKLPTVVATHTRPKDVPELRRRWQNGYMFGFGQALRKFIRSPRNCKDLLVRKWLQVLFLGWLFAGIGAFFVDPTVGLGWLTLSCGGFAVLTLREGMRQATMRVIWQFVAWFGYAYGFVRGSRGPAAYAIDAASLVSVPEDNLERAHPPFSKR